MVCDTSSLECKCCKESEGEDGEADDEWVCGRCEEDGVDEVGHIWGEFFLLFVGGRGVV